MEDCQAILRWRWDDKAFSFEMNSEEILPRLAFQLERHGLIFCYRGCQPEFVIAGTGFDGIAY